MSAAERIRVAVVYASPGRQELRAVELAAPAIVAEAIRASGLLESFPEIDLSVQCVGIFGRIVPPDTALRSGDQVEIYRPLAADPKEARRRRARRSRARRA